MKEKGNILFMTILLLMIMSGLAADMLAASIEQKRLDHYFTLAIRNK